MITRTFLVICAMLLFYIKYEAKGSHENNDSIYSYANTTTSKSSVLVIIQKCCPANQFIASNTIGENTYECVDYPKHQHWNPTLYYMPEVKLDSAERENLNLALDPVGFPTCSYLLLENRLDKWFNILNDGTPVVGLNFWTIAAWLKPLGFNYCVDAIHYKDELEVEGDIDNEKHYALVFCELEHFQFYITFRIGSATLFMISSISLLITLIIYLLIWEHQSIHGWTQFSFLLSFLLYYASEGSRIYAKANGLNIVPTKACFVNALIAHYFTIVISGTSCMMSLDCFVTFWKLRSTKTRGRKELVFYLLAAWGIPLVAFGVGLYIHFHTNPDLAEQQIGGVFEYAHYRCSSPIWEFAFRVQLLMLLVNTGAFIGTAYLICKNLRSTAFANHNNPDRSRKQFRKSSLLYLKLFLIMGVTNMLNAIDIFYGYKDPLGWQFVILRVCLSLQGIVYLVIFGLHRKNMQLLQRKYPKIQRIPLLACLCKSLDVTGSSGGGTSVTQKTTIGAKMSSIRERLNTITFRM